MPEEQVDHPMRLLRQIRSVGPDAPSREQKLELMQQLRAQTADNPLLLDEALLGEIELLRQGVERANRHHKELQNLFQKLTAPPWHVGVFLGGGAAGNRETAACVSVGTGRRVVNFADGIDPTTLKTGDAVLLNTEQNLVVAKSPYACLSSGETAAFDRFAGDRIVIRARDEEFVVEVADGLRQSDLRAGDVVRWDRNLWLAFDKLERSRGTQLFLEDTPNETFAAVGGLDAQIAELQRTIGMHHAHGDTVRRYRLRRRAAVLLAGPPGTGKTLIARALANWLAELSPAGRSRFMNVKPGSLHSMWYSQSEANYREAFRVAREAGEANPDTPVVMFFDEVDALGSARGDSVARVDDRVLTAFLTELDGLESRGNVLVVCATNRRDALDPALLRPGGRLGDIVLEIPRPNRSAAREIFARHLPESIPYARNETWATTVSDRDTLIEAAVTRIFAPNGHGELATLTLRDGTRRSLSPRELVSGALIANIALRAIEHACLRDVETGEVGVRLSDLLEAIDAELETAARVLTPANCRRHLETLPQDVDVVRVERSDPPARRSYRYLRVA